ncbi:MAG: hypothetical protein O3C21_08370 [Verrucomicrobia bacterium]|nr:hypothetical protein [Verrucomicrobiota bacterium]
MAVVGCGVLVVAFALPELATRGKWLLFVGGVMLTGAWLLLWRSSRRTEATESERLLELRHEIELEALRLEKQRAAWRRQRALHFGEEEIEFGSALEDVADEPAELIAVAEKPPKWDELDAKMLALMRVESERLFRNVLDNAYVRDGEFDRSRLGDDLIQLMESVARIYKPDSEHPLLETSVERLLRAMNHASVQMLVHLEQLPLDVKSYNLRETYQYIRSGTKYYGYYKKVEPYWTYARPLYHLGRLAMGTNPITIGVGWAVSELIKHGSVNYAHSYALRMLHDTVRILGNEAAGIFGNDFRHRDPAWIYGIEIVALMRAFPSTQARLEGALREVAGLTLRSEYDRIFLYGCLAGRTTPRPDRFAGRDFLTLRERQQIASRLERHVEKEGLDQSAREFEGWKAGAEQRLGIHLRLGSEQSHPTDQAATLSALRALASFLIQYKHKNCDDLRPLLSQTQLATGPSASEFDSAWQSIIAEPPMLYEIPVMVAGSSVVRRFLEDLIQIEAGHAPRFPESAEAIEETAGYYREDASKWQAKLCSAYTQFLLSGIDQAAGSFKQFPETAAPLLLGLLNEGESVEFFYDDLSIVSAAPSDALDSLTHRKYVLCATRERMLLIATSIEQSDVVWSAKKGGISIRRARGVVTDDCHISGGRWLLDAEQEPAAIKVAGRKLTSYEKRFAKLQDWVSEEAPLSAIG